MIQKLTIRIDQLNDEFCGNYLNITHEQNSHIGVWATRRAINVLFQDESCTYFMQFKDLKTLEKFKNEFPGKREIWRTSKENIQEAVGFSWDKDVS